MDGVVVDDFDVCRIIAPDVTPKQIVVFGIEIENRERFKAGSTQGSKCASKARAPLSESWLPRLNSDLY